MFSAQLTDVANRLVRICREGREREGLDELYAADAVSVEADAMPGMPGQELRGIEAIRGKHDWWNKAHTVHSAKIEGPFLHGPDEFGVIFDYDVTNKETKERTHMRELGVYHVRNGKIDREDFYYSA
jgi:hypothetical protein